MPSARVEAGIFSESFAKSDGGSNAQVPHPHQGMSPPSTGTFRRSFPFPDIWPWVEERPFSDRQIFPPHAFLIRSLIL